jgi:hypothetical protein
MFNNYANHLEFIREIARYDTIFSFEQINPDYIIKIANGLFLRKEWEEKIDARWSIRDAIEIIKNIIDIGKSNARSFLFYAHEIHLALSNIAPKRIDFILNKILSHSPGVVNSKYKFPAESTEITLMQKPLLTNGHGQFWVVDLSLNAPAFVESLMAGLRSEIPDIDRTLGSQIELFLKQEMRQRGLVVHGGNYKSSGKHGECDLVIETDSTIVFLEIKKKPLTRRARSGIESFILTDLAGSLLDAHLQTGWHEERMRRAGHLTLTNLDDNEVKIELNNRKIERIAVSLFDFGGFQDRTILSHVLETGLSVNFTYLDQKQKKAEEALNSSLNELRTQVTSLSNMKDSRRAFFDCWFVSIPQILLLLESAQTNSDFINALTRMKFVTFGTLDFYYEYSLIRDRK